MYEVYVKQKSIHYEWQFNGKTACPWNTAPAFVRVCFIYLSILYHNIYWLLYLVSYTVYGFLITRERFILFLIKWCMKILPPFSFHSHKAWSSNTWTQAICLCFSCITCPLSINWWKYVEHKFHSPVTARLGFERLWSFSQRGKGSPELNECDFFLEEFVRAYWVVFPCNPRYCLIWDQVIGSLKFNF